jgi:hypothetical protein
MFAFIFLIPRNLSKQLIPCYSNICQLRHYSTGYIYSGGVSLCIKQLLRGNVEILSAGQNIHSNILFFDDLSLLSGPFLLVAKPPRHVRALLCNELSRAIITSLSIGSVEKGNLFDFFNRIIMVSYA